MYKPKPTNKKVQKPTPRNIVKVEYHERYNKIYQPTEYNFHKPNK